MQTTDIGGVKPNEEMVSTRPSVPASERIARMREDILAAMYEGDIERARYYTRSYKQTEGEPPCMRAAKGLQETLRYMSIKIDDDDRLVGAKTIKRVSGPMGIERGFQDRVSMLAVPFHGKEVKDLAFLDDAATGGSQWVRKLLEMPDEEIREMKEEIMPYWTGKNMNSMMLARWKEAGYKFDRDYIYKMAATVADMQGHVLIGLNRILSLGFMGIARQAAEELAKLKPGAANYDSRKDFLESVQVSAMAVCEHSARYAQLASEMAKKASEPRKSELLDIAARCRRVPAEPPTNFMDALQAVWMSQIVLQISYGEDSIFSPGRVDQYLYPHYQKDLTAGRITRGAATEAIEEYYIKLSSFTGFGPNHCTIGGVNKQGDCVVNDMSYIMLEAFKNLKAIRNSLAVRISKNTPREFLLKACEAHRNTTGLAIYNDEVVIKNLMVDGYTLEDARDYGLIGCAELAGCGNSNGYASGSAYNLTSALEMALHEGKRYISGWQEQIGVKTPAAGEMKSFEDVKKALADQMSNAINVMVELTDIKDQVIAEHFPTPLLSATIEGCVESGMDVTRGGARYNHSTCSAQGIATAANSMAAIKWAVFDKKLVTMEELVGHLRSNFANAEELRQQLLNKAPKYGTDNPEADDIALWIIKVADTESRKHKRPLDGGTYRTMLISAGTQVMGGRILGATPDGRKAGEPVSNGISPANGTETQGMTAALRSVAKVSEPPLSGGTALNMTVNPATIRTDEGLEKFASMVEGYFELGGRQVQFNPVNRQILLEAQKKREAYPDLMVRVSGYSYRFIDLSRGLQDDIIARTEFCV